MYLALAGRPVNINDGQTCMRSFCVARCYLISSLAYTNGPQSLFVKDLFCQQCGRTYLEGT